MIHATITGNIGKDAETRAIPSGDTVTSFSVASNRKVKERDETTWVTVHLWGKRGEKLSQYLTKGTAVTVVGEFTTREYQDKSGEKRTSLECRASDIALHGGGNAELRHAKAKSPERDRPDSAGDAYEPNF